MKANGGLTRKIVSVLENTFYLWGIVDLNEALKNL
jgi:hypothetical protein